jgi:hypothetical protein
MKAFINTIINWLFKNSWVTLLLSFAVPFLFMETYNGWILFFSFIYFFPEAIIHYKGKRWVGSPQPEPVNVYWSKEKDAYHFSLYGNTEDKKLHSEEAFFSMTINRNSRIAKLRYGSY